MKLLITEMERPWQLSACRDWLMSLMQAPLALRGWEAGSGRGGGGNCG